MGIKILVIQEETIYGGLIETLNSCLGINVRQKYIYVTMDVENWINGLPYEIQDDHNIWCLLSLVRKIKKILSGL